MELPLSQTSSASVARLVVQLVSEKPETSRSQDHYQDSESEKMSRSLVLPQMSEYLGRIQAERRLSSALTTRANNLKTKERPIEAREWIDDGIIGSQRIMRDLWSYFEALVRLSHHQNLTCHEFSWSVGSTLASLWVFIVNARSEPIERMTLKYWKTNKFKFFYFHYNVQD